MNTLNFDDENILNVKTHPVFRQGGEIVSTIAKSHKKRNRVIDVEEDTRDVKSFLTDTFHTIQNLKCQLENLNTARKLDQKNNENLALRQDNCALEDKL